MKELYNKLISLDESLKIDNLDLVEIRVTKSGLLAILPILKRLQWWGNIGHCGTCDMEYGFKRGFDGDGSDQIPLIKVNGRDLKNIDEFRDIKYKDENL